MNSKATTIATETDFDNTSKPSKRVEENKSQKCTARTSVTKTLTPETSHTKFYKQRRHEDFYRVVSRDEYLGVTESVSGSSDTHGCIHGPQGKAYSTYGLMKRNILKNLDPVPVDPKWTEPCPVGEDWTLTDRIEFLVTDVTVVHQTDRLAEHLRDLIKISSRGYRIDVLPSICTILQYLIEDSKAPTLKPLCVSLLQNMQQPIRLISGTDTVTYHDNITCYLDFLAYLLITLDDDNHFALASEAILWQLSAADKDRGLGVALRRACLSAVSPAMLQTAGRMIAVARHHRFPTFMQLALILACDTADNCLFMMRENILEHILYRFNPYFPRKCLPCNEINPADTQDPCLKLGDSSKIMSTTLSLLLVLLKTTLRLIQDNLSLSKSLPCPNSYALRCFIWVFRYECRARAHHHERATLTAIIMLMLHCFGNRLHDFESRLMYDVMTISVKTEVTPKKDWISGIHFGTGQEDVRFKKLLIYLAVDMCRVFPYISTLTESCQWLLGLTLMLDPDLRPLRPKWPSPLYAELRKVALQTLVFMLPRVDPKLISDYGIIRRIFWYVEWYAENPYEIQVLYWCLRVLWLAISRRPDEARQRAVNTLFDSHANIVLIHLCDTLLLQNLPPLELVQATMMVALRLLTSCAGTDRCVLCVVYPLVLWPYSTGQLADDMLNTAIHCLQRNYIITDRWLVAVLNFLWQNVVWRPERRQQFISDNGVYRLLDLITMTRPPVQCMGLAVLCDMTRAGVGHAVAQLVTWRAGISASDANPVVVKCGATIASLLASLVRTDCHLRGIAIDDMGVLQDVQHPPTKCQFTAETLESRGSQLCAAAADVAGSIIAKAFALLHMLSDDLVAKVELADESYHLYKDIKLDVKDEVVLILCTHYLTLQLGKAWREVHEHSAHIILPTDLRYLHEYLHVSSGWEKEIRRQQLELIENDRKKDLEEEASLYSLLSRIRLTIALRALRDVRHSARASAREVLTHSLGLGQLEVKEKREAAVLTHGPIIPTYTPALDDKNMTGQMLRVISIKPKKAVPDMTPLLSSPSIFSDQSVEKVYGPE